MLIKTKEFEYLFNKQMYQLSINKNDISLRGSYKNKVYGDIITDIDLAQNINILSPFLLQNIYNTIKKLKNFIFIRLHCGTYVEFETPWKINKSGECEFDRRKSLEWFKNIKQKKLIDINTLDEIKNLLFSDKLTIKNLFEIKQLIRPYSEILWNINDIQKGYKTVRNNKYDLISLMKKGHVVIIRYLYKYNDEIISIDFSLIDDAFLIQPSILYEYYKENEYKIFKSYKWYLLPEYYKDYFGIMKKIENYNGLLNRIKLISTVVKYKLLSENQINNLINDAIIFSEKIGINYSGIENSKTTETLLTEKIEKTILKYKQYFREKIQKRNIPEVEFYELLLHNTKSIDNSKFCLNDDYNNSNCPFFYLQLNEFKYALQLARKSLINPKIFFNCVKHVNVSLFKIFPKNSYSIIEIDNDMWLRKGFAKIKKIEKDKLNQYQIFVLIYNSTSKTSAKTFSSAVPIRNNLI